LIVLKQIYQLKFNPAAKGAKSKLQGKQVNSLKILIIYIKFYFLQIIFSSAKNGSPKP
jgi:hypothetical protein